MWLETDTFMINKNETLEVNIKIGEKLQGSNRPYIPNDIEEFYWSQNGKKFKLIRKIRKRYECKDLLTKKLYLFNPNYKICL